MATAVSWNETLANAGMQYNSSIGAWSNKDGSYTLTADQAAQMFGAAAGTKTFNTFPVATGIATYPNTSTTTITTGVSPSWWTPPPPVNGLTWIDVAEEQIAHPNMPTPEFSLEELERAEDIMEECR